MEILFWLILSNTALFTLVWLVQLVIYPGLLYYNEIELGRWHPIYTRQVSLIIAPLMLMQGALYALLVLNTGSLMAISGLILASSTWFVTFRIAVPLHKAIDQENETITIRQKLIRVNWIRTIAWTGCLILSLFEYGK